MLSRPLLVMCIWVMKPGTVFQSSTRAADKDGITLSSTVPHSVTIT